MKTHGDLLEINTVLIKRAADGDDAAFKTLYDSISGKMYSLCLRYAEDDEEANDFFQEGFIKLYRHLSNFRNEGSFEGWARRIFVTTCLDLLKKKRIRFSDIDENIHTDAEQNTVIDKLSTDLLLKVVQKLPAGYRTIVNLYIIEDYSHKEIAEMLGITESGSKSKLHKARTYLKTLWAKEDV